METKESLSLFIVDDDPFCLNLYGHHIRQLGYPRTTIFNDGQECLNRLTEQPDIIFLDYQMEPLNGLDVLRKIKRFNPNIYMVVLSGQDDMEVAVNALKYGAFDYIIKGKNDLAKIETVLTKIQTVMAELEKRPRRPWQKLVNLFNAE